MYFYFEALTECISVENNKKCKNSENRIIPKNHYCINNERIYKSTGNGCEELNPREVITFEKSEIDPMFPFYQNNYNNKNDIVIYTKYKVENEKNYYQQVFSKYFYNGLITLYYCDDSGKCNPVEDDGYFINDINEIYRKNNRGTTEISETLSNTCVEHRVNCSFYYNCYTQDGDTNRNHVYIDGTNSKNLITCSPQECTSSPGKVNYFYLDVFSKSSDNPFNKDYFNKCEENGCFKIDFRNYYINNYSVIDGTSEIEDNLFKNIIIGTNNDFSNDNHLIEFTRQSCSYVSRILYAAYIHGNEMTADSHFKQIIICSYGCKSLNNGIFLEANSRTKRNTYKNLYICKSEVGCYISEYYGINESDRNVLYFNLDILIIKCISNDCHLLSNEAKEIRNYNNNIEIYSYFIDGLDSQKIICCEVDYCTSVLLEISTNDKYDNYIKFTYGYFFTVAEKQYFKCDNSGCNEIVIEEVNNYSSSIGKLITLKKDKNFIKKRLYLCINSDKAIKIDHQGGIYLVESGFPGFTNKSVMVKIEGFRVTLISDQISYLNMDDDGNATNILIICTGNIKDDSYEYGRIIDDYGNHPNIIICTEDSVNGSIICTSSSTKTKQLENNLNYYYYYRKDNGFIRCNDLNCEIYNGNMGFIVVEYLNELKLIKIMKYYRMVYVIITNQESCSDEDNDIGNIVLSDNIIKICKTDGNLIK
eukprot:jgi/Orpsp1_1/1180343/evm.model.c7180000073029.1